jgi:hypothetical protein
MHACMYTLHAGYRATPADKRCCGDVPGQHLVLSSDSTVLFCSNAANAPNKSHDVVKLAELQRQLKEVLQQGGTVHQLLPGINYHSTDPDHAMTPDLMAKCWAEGCGQPMKVVVAAANKKQPTDKPYVWFVCPGHYTDGTITTNQGNTYQQTRTSYTPPLACNWMQFATQTASHCHCIATCTGMHKIHNLHLCRQMY